MRPPSYYNSIANHNERERHFWREPTSTRLLPTSSGASFRSSQSSWNSPSQFSASRYALGSSQRIRRPVGGPVLTRGLAAGSRTPTRRFSTRVAPGSNYRPTSDAMRTGMVSPSPQIRSGHQQRPGALSPVGLYSHSSASTQAQASSSSSLAPRNYRPQIVVSPIGAHRVPYLPKARPVSPDLLTARSSPARPRSPRLLLTTSPVRELSPALSPSRELRSERKTVSPPEEAQRAELGEASTASAGRQAKDLETKRAERKKRRTYSRSKDTTTEEDKGQKATKTRESSTEKNAASLEPPFPIERDSNRMGVVPGSFGPSCREFNFEDFNFLAALGRGGGGIVALAELKDNQECFAIKCLNKFTIQVRNDYESAINERQALILGNLNGFICKLFCTFQTDDHLFIAMEYCPGGDLMFHLQNESKFSESRSRFYAAEIICAIKFLHQKNIIYRDLKLDNILLDTRGHIRLVDFGMCKFLTHKEELSEPGFCGTPEYMAPEMILGLSYNHSVDWWSFGVSLYEMVVGKMPFGGEDENELLLNVCSEEIEYPSFLSEEITHLLKSLFDMDPWKRMGMAQCEICNIEDHPFFRPINWKDVEELRMEPPFVPQVTSKRDVQNFDSTFTETDFELPPVNERALAEIDQTRFEGFDFTNPESSI